MAHIWRKYHFGIFRVMKTTTVPEIVFHTIIDNDASLIKVGREIPVVGIPSGNYR